MISKNARKKRIIFPAHGVKAKYLTVFLIEKFANLIIELS